MRGLFWSDRVPTLEGSPVVGTVRCNQRLTYFDYGGIALLKRQRCGFIRAWGTVPGFGEQTYNQRWRGDSTAVLLWTELERHTGGQSQAGRLVERFLPFSRRAGVRHDSRPCVERSLPFSKIAVRIAMENWLSPL